MSDKIMVSISCLVYNHEKYIRQCLDGMLMQKTDFKYEILIHDDASTDGSADIIREYDNPTGERKSVAEKLSDSVDSVMDHFVFGDRVKVMINGEVVALTRSADEGEKAYKAARLAINKDGIKPLWIETDYEPIDKDNEAVMCKL